MLSFFRKIRLTLLGNGSIGKYLKYAIGEIVLVVIGILLALQINNWNEDQKIQRKERILLQNLQEEFQTQISAMETYIEIQQLVKEDIEVIIEHYNNHGFTQLDSIFKRINDVSIRTTFTNQISSLTEMIASGEINILDNQDLKKDLLRFNQSMQTFMDITKNNNTYLIDQIMVPSVIKHSDFASYGYTDKLVEALTQFEGNLTTAKSKRKQHRDSVERILGNPENSLQFINQIVLRFNLATIQCKSNQILIEKARTILEKLENELSNS